ncbi:hypothetical protein [Streptomyces sp. NPDC056480]|uniref:hypothetical protein n=1 Tax=Streptomyces sp. NPDC056480 TaxID=3345833 RepID=UPI0036BF1ACC
MHLARSNKIGFSAAAATAAFCLAAGIQGLSGTVGTVAQATNPDPDVKIVGEKRENSSRPIGQSGVGQYLVDHMS